MPDLIHPENLFAIEAIAVDGRNEPVRRRAKVLLLYHAGHPTADVAERVGLSISSVLRWRREYRARGMDIFPDAGEAPAPTPAWQAPEAAKTTGDKAGKGKKKDEKKSKKKKGGKGKKKDGKAGKGKKKKAAKGKKKKEVGKKKKAGKKAKKRRR